jgi:RNA polymerase sigma-70 factor (ECF subfamily)
MNQFLDEAAFIFAFQQGDEKALNFIFKKYSKGIIFFAAKIVHDLHLAEDIVSESYVKLWRIHRSFDSVANIRSFLFVTTRNACYNYLKSSYCKYGRLLDLACCIDSPDETNVNDFSQLILSKIGLEVNKLPIRQREVVKLLLLKQRKVPFVASRLGLSRQTVRNHKTRALLNLRKSLSIYLEK